MTQLWKWAAVWLQRRITPAVIANDVYAFTCMVLSVWHHLEVPAPCETEGTSVPTYFLIFIKKLDFFNENLKHFRAWHS